MTGWQRQLISVLVLSLLVALGAAALRSGIEDGERIATGAGSLGRAGLTTIVEALPEVADPPATTTSTGPPAAPSTSGPRRPVQTTSPATTTTAPRATTTTVPTLVLAASLTTTTTAAPAPTTTAAPAPTTTAVPATTTTTLDPCRNSTDPACGPFRFDPQPGADRPMTVEVTVEPPAPVAGQPMVFHITLTDPDGVSYDGTTFNFGNSGIGGSTPEPCAKFGPWDPPARDPASAVKTVAVTHTYDDAGSYTATFLFDAGPFDCVDSVTGRGDRPYASSATGTVTVAVGPAS